MDIRDFLQRIPSLPQRKDSVSTQLEDLQRVANRLGMHDAADVIAQMFSKLKTLKYGCYCDLEDGMVPDDCVIDSGIGHCHYAKPGMRKEQCEYWRLLQKVEVTSHPETILTWTNIKDKLPEGNGRVLVFSPAYLGHDETMVFRILNAQFVRMLSEDSMWVALPDNLDI